MQLSDKVKAILALQERTNVLATTDPDGKVNLGVYGSFQTDGDSGVMIMLGDNRAWANITRHPHAAALVFPAGKKGMELAGDGCRLYLKVIETADSGAKYDEVLAALTARTGKAAGMLKHLVRFEVVEARPILDMGQGV
jgi:hypothetical protein